MPKLKTKSSLKKRFSITSTGHIRRSHAGKRHGMIKRTNKQIRQLRGTTLMAPADEKRVLKYFTPYGLP